MTPRPRHPHTRTATERLHAHIRVRLQGLTELEIAAAIVHADAVFCDGIGSMQAALEAAIHHAHVTPRNAA
jgi:hypothetical protein